MSEQTNQNVNQQVFDPKTQKFVDFSGLDYFWGKAKEYIDNVDDAVKNDISSINDKIGDVNNGIIKDIETLKDDISKLGGTDGGIQGMIDSSIQGLDVTDTAVSGQYVSSVSEVDGKIVVSREDLPDFTDAISTAKDLSYTYTDQKTKVNADAITGLTERVADLEGINIAKDIVYENSYIYLVDENDQKIGDGFDASAFIVDGMLDSVDFEKIENEDGSETRTNNLVFTFNTESGKESFSIDFGQYVDAYHADNSSIALDSTTNTFSLKSADADLVQVDSIQVGGTPLANILLDNNISEISAGNLQGVLEALFSKNNYPTVSLNVPSKLTVSMSNPTLTFTSSDSIQEVGSSIVITASSANASASASANYTGFEYGYATALKPSEAEQITAWTANNYKSGNPASFNAVNISAKTDSTYKLTFTVNSGFNNATISDVTAKTLTATDNVTVEVAKGTNKITLYAYSPEFKGEIPASTKYYIVSSLTKTSEDKVLDVRAKSDIFGDSVVKSTNKSVTGEYAIYVACPDSKMDSSSKIKAGGRTAWTNGDSNVTLAGGTFKAGKYSSIAMPNDWKLKSVINGMDLDITSNFASYEEVDYTLPNNTTKKYKVYSNVYGSDIVYKSITIGK